MHRCGWEQDDRPKKAKIRIRQMKSSDSKPGVHQCMPVSNGGTKRSKLHLHGVWGSRAKDSAVNPTPSPARCQKDIAHL